MILPIPGTATQAPLPVCIASLNQAIDQATQSQQCFANLGALFRAIERLSEAHSPSSELATLGHALAGEWANLCDVEREELELCCAELQRRTQGEST
ncbi:hypothetical protein [Chitiniphilus eburneus]|uniref:Uncharacterized protein n=1 Tax=Chitiniphilus eburneus TaxID=2571148 RepID=A0A4V6WI33_9NEIS|nr:hypothetical protein [Chitiniphilus eburneus]TJZ68368.1 hypothetical protein FAZ21_15675 [Chitiniphilus eburneus]